MRQASENIDDMELCMTCGALCSADMLKRSTLFSLPPFSTFRNEQLAQRAEDLTHLFEQEPRQEPAAAQSNLHVLAGRRFFKNFPSIVDSRIDTCRREHLALKLGIPGDVFAFNPGFEKFATDSHLERYLMEYHHTLHVNPHTQELSIRANGEYVQWAEANAEKGTIAPVLLRTYQRSRSSGCIRYFASAWRKALLTRPLSIKSLT